MELVQEAVDSSEPLRLLRLVSSFEMLSDPGSVPSTMRDNKERLTFDELLDSFIELSTPQTSAVLAVSAATHPDELRRSRIKRELVQRGHKLPGWLRHLELSTTGARRLTEEFGDSEHIIIGARIGTSHEFTLMVLVDHHAGSVAKDVILNEQSLDDTMRLVVTMPGADELTVTSITRADARAKLEQAVLAGRQIHPPFETDSWPAERSLVEWVLASMPTGGEGWVRAEWSDEDQLDLADEFFGSTFSPGLGGPGAESAVDMLLSYAIHHSTGDPLRWSATALEILLLDWIPRTIIATHDDLMLIPQVLRSFIPFAHEKAGLPASLTAESLASLAALMPAYLVQVDRLLGTDEVKGFEADDDLNEWMLRQLSQAVGGADELSHLDAAPLPPEDLDLSTVPHDIRGRVAGIAEVLDDVSRRSYGVEIRTVWRRLLHDIATGDPSIFRRKSSDDRTSAAIAWIGAKANHLVGYAGKVATQDFLDEFGITGSVSQRAEVMQKAIGVNPYQQYGQMNLGTARYLTSTRRAGLIETRDYYEAQRAADD